LDTPLRSIPFQKYASRVITIANGALCTGPYQPKIRITSTCEMDAEVYQYGVVMNTTTHMADISYLPDDRLYANNDTYEIYLDFTPVVTGGQQVNVGGNAQNEHKPDTFAMIAAVFSINIAFFIFVCYKLMTISHTLKSLKPPENVDDTAAVHKEEFIAKAPVTNGRGHDKSDVGVEMESISIRMESIYDQNSDSVVQMQAKPINETNV